MATKEKKQRKSTRRVKIYDANKKNPEDNFRCAYTQLRITRGYMATDDAFEIFHSLPALLAHARSKGYHVTDPEFESKLCARFSQQVIPEAPPVVNEVTGKHDLSAYNAFIAENKPWLEVPGAITVVDYRLAHPPAAKKKSGTVKKTVKEETKVKSKVTKKSESESAPKKSGPAAKLAGGVLKLPGGNAYLVKAARTGRVARAFSSIKAYHNYRLELLGNAAHESACADGCLVDYVTSGEVPNPWYPGAFDDIIVTPAKAAELKLLAEDAEEEKTEEIKE